MTRTSLGQHSVHPNCVSPELPCVDPQDNENSKGVELGIPRGIETPISPSCVFLRMGGEHSREVSIRQPRLRTYAPYPPQRPGEFAPIAHLVCIERRVLILISNLLQTFLVPPRCFRG